MMTDSKRYHVVQFKTNDENRPNILETVVNDWINSIQNQNVICFWADDKSTIASEYSMNEVVFEYFDVDMPFNAFYRGVILAAFGESWRFTAQHC